MSDTAYPVFQHYGTNAQRLAFTPAPPATGQPIYIWYETDNPDDFYIYASGAWKGPYTTGSGAGTVTNTGTLTDHALIVGNGGVDVSALASLGTTTTVLHGNAAADPTFGAVDLAADVTGALPAANGGTGQTTYTKGDLLVTPGSTTINKLAVGTDGDVLTADAASTNGVKWAAAGGGGGGWTLLHTYTASASASIDVTSQITSTYDTYVIVLTGVLNATNTHKLQMLVSSDNGSTWVSTNYYNVNFYMANTGGPAADISGPVGAWNLNLNQDTSFTEGVSGEIWLLNPLASGTRFQTFGRTIISNASAIVSYTFGGSQVSSAAFDAVQFKYDTGNIASGAISIFGVSK